MAKKKASSSIEADYSKMLDKVKHRDDKGDEYLYICAADHKTKTVAVDTGLIPVKIDCPVCGKPSVSKHKVEIPATMITSMEWYRPTVSATSKLSEVEQKKVLKGELLLRQVIHQKTKQGD